MHYRQILETLYQSDASTLDKKEQKASIFSELRDEFNRMKTNKNGLSAYDNWMNHSLNNAKISSVAAYHDFVPAFQKMLVDHDGNLNQFYTACRELARRTKDERHRLLNSYLAN
jgi:predicted aminopeptidase